MISSARQAIACILLILPTIIFAQSQTASDKTSTGSVSGKVTLKGTGISGVAVGLILVSPQRHLEPTRYKTTTDESGDYRLTNVPAGNYEVGVSTPAYVLTDGSGNYRKSVVIGKGETAENVDFALVRGGVITGRVTDSEGRPVIEVDVVVLPAQMGHGTSMRAGIRTDDRGIYRAFGLAPGKYKVSAGHDEQSLFGNPWATRHKQTFHPAAAEISQATILEVTEGSETTDVDITLGRSMVKYTASGRIIDGETGQPVVGARYGVHMFVHANYEGSRTVGMTTNKEGEFRLDNLAPGNYAVIAEPPPDGDWRVEPFRFQIIDQDVSGMVVKTSKGASVSGVILLDGAESKPLPNITKSQLNAYVATRKSAQGSNHVASINADGTFRISGLPNGLMSISLWGRDRLQIVQLERDGIVSTRGIELKELEQVTNLRVVVNYANGAIRGAVKLATGSLTAGARLHVTIKRVGDDQSVWTSNDTPMVDPRGQFFAEGLLPGTYEVKAYLYLSMMMDNPQPQATQQVIVTNGNVSNVTLTLGQK